MAGITQHFCPAVCARRGYAPGCALPARGMTIMEVLVAVVILTIASTLFFRFLVIGDLQRTRILRIERAAMCAAAEAERLKARSGEATAMPDTSYEVVLDSMRFLVTRAGIVPDGFDNSDAVVQDMQEISITVQRIAHNSPPLKFRVLHPHAGENE